MKKEPLLIAYLIALLAFSVAIGFTSVSDDDTFWHVALGQYIVDNPIAHKSPFTFVDTQGDLWQDQSWLFNGFSYLIHSVGGVVGLQMARVLMLFLLGFSLIKHYGPPAFFLALWLITCTHFTG